jgi:hypothetical protein
MPCKWLKKRCPCISTAWRKTENLRTDRIPETGPGDLIVSVSIYPDMVKDEINNRREKTTVTIPRWLKEAAEAEGINYSRLLEIAVKETLGIGS